MDIGCAGGLLYDRLKLTNMEKYIGVDLATHAIECAKNQFDTEEDRNKASFSSGDLLGIEFPEIDVAVALGVLEWLNLEEIQKLLGKIAPKPFLFSISEKTNSLARWVHSIYVYLAYGWKTKGYVPQYYSVEELISIAKSCGYDSIKIYRHKELRFGAFLYNLD